jgi:hypothetical protein
MSGSFEYKPTTMGQPSAASSTITFDAPPLGQPSAASSTTSCEERDAIIGMVVPVVADCHSPTVEHSPTVDHSSPTVDHSPPPLC